MKQMLIVTKEIYLRHVKSWSFLMMVLSPFLLFALSGGVGYLTAKSNFKSDELALVSDDQQVLSNFSDDETFVAYKTEQEAKKAVKDKKASGYVLLANQKSQIVATYHGDTGMSPTLKTKLWAKLNQVQSQLNISQVGLSQEQVQELSRTPQLSEKINQAKENKKTIQTLAFMVLSVLLYFILLTYSALTAQEVASEKGTKIMEVVFSSIRASQYFYGRLLGIFGVILTHLAVYLLGGLLILFAFSGQASFQNILKSHPDFMSQLANAFSLNTLAFVVVGLCIYVALSAFCGSLVTRAEDANKAIQPVMMLVMLGFIGVVSLGNIGDTLIMKIGSYIPFISTFFMPFRVINGYASSGEAWLSLLLLLAFTLAFIAYVGRIYASLILQTDDVGLWKSFRRAIRYR
ncbi:ABC transporter permease [Streptococcus oricebi]|uniref:ABC transporter permease n=1 Tax=Streptococcus oricebi TaxID=1547447 RepID=A0ABS5B2E9_9STRE|nr:ABC transporter permease [Streptococcus oricebi]MBP2623004.1 ABC transporter permease [Streptococcus oricebi]